MEYEILKFICANRGAADTAELVCNLYVGQSSAVTDVICNQEKFVACCVNGEPKVVARTRMWLCRAKDCPGTCKGLHLCKNYLFSGTCHFSQMRRTCHFSHQLDSDHNRKILSTYQLEKLNRAELCTLLLQSNNALLPPICFDYNNGTGQFGRCQDADDCKRLHICEKSLHQECHCPRSHNFSDPQPFKILKNANVPDSLCDSLKSAYSNKAALRDADKLSGRLKEKAGSAAGHDHESSSDNGMTVKPKEWVRGRGRGRGGNRGNRGHRGNPGNRGNRGGYGNQRTSSSLSRSSSISDIFADVSFFDPGNSPSTLQWQQRSELDDSDARSDTSHSSTHAHRQKKTSAAVRGSGGNRSNVRLDNGATSDTSAATNDEGRNADDGANRKQRQRPVRDKTEICMYFIKGFCKHEERCFKAHDKMPYRWEVNEDGKWTPLPDNEAIEKDYCDPKNSYSSSSPPVYFDTMTRGANNVRRLSTVNSVVEPEFIHTTEWLWYWQDETSVWKLYASDSGRHGPSDINSTTLEKKFLANDKDVVEFTAGSQSYSLSFQDMMQKNKRYDTVRGVCRRPRFVSAEEVRATKGRKPHLNSVPDHWDKTQICATGFKRIILQPTSAEFKEVKALFSQSMAGFVVKIERIQNKALWETFQLHKTQMRLNNGGRDITEKMLFHGTDVKHVDNICRDNLDWRICGTHGTVYGKGSYFARDAHYSDSYASGDSKTMFVCRVLVGDYTKGHSSYVKPPFKDGGEVHRYHSCVNNVTDPSIFVVFDTAKIYPEYLLQYKGTGAAAAAPAPKPVVAPNPVVHAVPSRPSTSSQHLYANPYQRTPSSYHHVPSYSSSTSTASPFSQASRFSPPSSPKPTKPKSQDSCVIA